MPEGPLGFPRLTSIGPFSRKTREEVMGDWQDCLESGKPRQICRSIKFHTLRVINNDLRTNPLYGSCDTAQEVNEGRCDIVALKVLEEIDNINVMQYGIGEHYWIEYNGRHYDAEVPTGVNDPKDLPAIQRFPSRVALETAREELKSKGETDLPEDFNDLVTVVAQPKAKEMAEQLE